MHRLSPFNGKIYRQEFSSLLKIKSDSHNGQNTSKLYKRALCGLAFGLLTLWANEKRNASADTSHLHVQFKELAKKRYALQYSANNPIEDRVLFGQLNAVRGEVLAVFDGHGGFSIGKLTSRLRSEELAG
jgi:hypothetical protein